MKNRKFLIQFIKFGIVGVSNTLLTLITIWILLKVFLWSDYASNIIGYIVGLVNSFIWNRKWTFNSSTKVKDTILKFIITFAISYCIQLGFLYILLHYSNIDSYFCQILSTGFYTIVNFLFNKFYTFKISKNE
ncbi:MAG: GtrA family protein [Paludibacter sp.]